MKSPCYCCTKRTAVPNCHAGCQDYLDYAVYCENMRIKRHNAIAGDDARIQQLEKRKRAFFKQRRK